jgi:hypothetical protein
VLGLIFLTSISDAIDELYQKFRAGKGAESLVMDCVYFDAKHGERAE